MDEQEESNISTLSDILKNQKTTGKVFPCGKNADDIRTRIFVFCQSGLSVAMANSLFAKYENNPLIIRSISDYTNAAGNLMYEVPLFIPLLNSTRGFSPTVADGHTVSDIGEFFVEKDDKNRLGGVIPTRELHVSILGEGALAEEAFKAVFWCGQIAGVQLYIHVDSNNAKKFKRKLISSCPELLKSCYKNSEILKCYPDKDCALYNAPYAIIDGLDKDVDAENYADYQEIIKKSDYMIVPLGNECRNIAVSLILKQQLSKYDLLGKEKSHRVIAPAVYNEGLAETIAVKSPNEHEPYIVPFALRRGRFSCQSVFMSDITVESWKSQSLYNEKNRKERKNDEYSYWANIYKSIHAPYKLFAFGLIKNVDLTVEDTGDVKERYIGTGTENNIEPNDTVFTWLEHRRWNACMRTQGFAMPTDEEHASYFREKKLHKDLLRKFHNCLVEASTRGKQMPENDEFDSICLDALDIESVKSYLMNRDKPLQKKEYKQYDEYCSDEASKELLRRLTERNEQ